MHALPVQAPATAPLQASVVPQPLVAAAVQVLAVQVPAGKAQLAEPQSPATPHVQWPLTHLPPPHSESSVQNLELQLPWTEPLHCSVVPPQALFTQPCAVQAPTVVHTPLPHDPPAVHTQTPRVVLQVAFDPHCAFVVHAFGLQ